MRRRGRWFRRVGIREAEPLPWLPGLVCGAAPIALWINFVLFMSVGVPLYSTSQDRFAFADYVVARAGEIESLLFPVAVIALVLVAAVHGLGPGTGRRLTPIRRAFRLAADFVFASTFLMLVWFTFGTLRSWPTWYALVPRDTKLEVFLPRSEDGVGRPPPDGIPEVVVEIELDADRRPQVRVAGVPVEALSRAAVAAGIRSAAGRIGVPVAAARVRFDVAPTCACRMSSSASTPPAAKEPPSSGSPESADRPGRGERSEGRGVRSES